MPPTSKPAEPEGGDSTIESENGDASDSSSEEKVVNLAPSTYKLMQWEH